MSGIPSLETALESLPTPRIQRLVNRLELDPELEVTVGGWWPQCPMTLAGYEARQDAAGCQFGPEHRFAIAWDHFAQREHRRWWHSVINTPYRARRSDVQALLRMANATLAHRAGRAPLPNLPVSGETARASASADPPTSASDDGLSVSDHSRVLR